MDTGYSADDAEYSRRLERLRNILCASMAPDQVHTPYVYTVAFLNESFTSYFMCTGDANADWNTQIPLMVRICLDQGFVIGGGQVSRVELNLAKRSLRPPELVKTVKLSEL